MVQTELNAPLCGDLTQVSGCITERLGKWEDCVTTLRILVIVTKSLKVSSGHSRHRLQTAIEDKIGRNEIICLIGDVPL